MGLLSRYAGAIRTAEFALAATAFFTAWAFGDDLVMLWLAVIFGTAFACIGILSAPTLGNRTKAIWCVVALLVFAAEAALVRHHYRQREADANLTAALMQYSVTPAIQSRDGQLYFPAQVMNVGSEGTLGDSTVLREALSPKKFSPEQEEKFMASIEKEMRQRIKSGHPDIRRVPGFVGLVPNRPDTLILPVPKDLGPGVFNSVVQGNKILYYGLLTVFNDRLSEAQGYYWFAEACFLYDPSLGMIVECQSQNTRFPRKRFHLN